MCATVVATTLSSILSRETIYTLKLTRRGIDILQRKQPTLLQLLTVADAARPMPDRLPCDLPLEQVADRFADSTRSRSRYSMTTADCAASSGSEMSRTRSRARCQGQQHPTS